MNSEEDKTIDSSTEPTPAVIEAEPKQAKGDALSGISRLLSEEEMKDNPGAFKLVLDRVDKLEAEVKNLSEYREKFHEQKTKAEVLEKNIESLKDAVNSKSVLILLAGALLGSLTSLWNYPPIFITFIIISLVFLALGFSNLFKK